MSLISALPVRARDPDEAHRVSTPLELLFDLVTVIAVAAVTAGLHHAIAEGHGAAMLPRFAVMFMAIWWAWMNYTWHASAFDDGGAVFRLLTVIVMTGALIFAGGAGFIEATLDFQWGIAGWIIMRLGMAGLWLRAAGLPQFRGTALRYAAGITLSQAYWIALYLAAAPGSPGFLAGMVVGFALELLVPVIAERHHRTPSHRHHIIERYGLLTIISLGEIMLSISAGFGMMYGAGGETLPAITALSGIVIVMSLFWIYFAAEEHMPDPGLLNGIIWGYGHVLVYAGIAVTGAAIGAQLDLAHGDAAAVQADLARWLGGALAVVFAALWAVRDRMHAIGPRGWALPAGAALMLAAAAAGLPVWGIAALSLAVLLMRVRGTEAHP